MKYSPSPWKPRKIHLENPIREISYSYLNKGIPWKEKTVGIINKNRRTICHVCYSTCDLTWPLLNDLEEFEANICLISAAPELLEALKYARRFLNKNEHDTDYLDNVIAKVERSKV